MKKTTLLIGTDEAHRIYMQAFDGRLNVSNVGLYFEISFSPFQGEAWITVTGHPMAAIEMIRRMSRKIQKREESLPA